MIYVFTAWTIAALGILFMTWNFKRDWFTGILVFIVLTVAIFIMGDYGRE